MKALHQRVLLAVVLACAAVTVVLLSTARGHGLLLDDPGTAADRLARTYLAPHIAKRASALSARYGLIGDGKPSTANLTRRTNDDDDDTVAENADAFQVLSYDAYSKRGETFVRYMYMKAEDIDQELHDCHKLPAGGTAQSRFTKYTDLEAYGWKASDDDKSVMHFADYGPVPIRKTINDLSLSAFFNVAPLDEHDNANRPGGNPGQNAAIRLTHGSEKKVGGVTYHPTGGFYSSVYNPTEGVIIAYDSDGPQHRVTTKEQQYKGIRAPPLRQWSDVTFLEYDHLCNKESCKPSNLHYIFRAHIDDNKGVNRVLNHILEPHKPDDRGVTNSQAPSAPPPWNPNAKERKMYHIMTPEGHALLGSPVGVGVGRFLVTHKAQLGDMRVKSITIFQSGGSFKKLPCLLFEIQKVTMPGKSHDSEGEGPAMKWTREPDGKIHWNSESDRESVCSSPWEFSGINTPTPADRKRWRS